MEGNTRLKGESMKAKDYLMQVKKLDRLIENKLIEKEQWFAIATGITTSSSDGERVQSSGSQEKMANAVCRMADIEAEIDALVDEFIDTKQGVIRTIEHLPADEYDVIHKMYIQNKSLKETAASCGKSYEWTKTVHRQGIRDIQTFLGKKVTRIPNYTQ